MYVRARSNLVDGWFRCGPDFEFQVCSITFVAAWAAWGPMPDDGAGCVVVTFSNVIDPYFEKLPGESPFPADYGQVMAHM